MASRPSEDRKQSRSGDLAPKAVPAERAAGVSASAPQCVRLRPTWHRVVGGSEVAVGLLLIVPYYTGGEAYALPLVAPVWWALFGGTLAYYATFWFGWWDRAC